MNRGLAGS